MIGNGWSGAATSAAPPNALVGEFVQEAIDLVKSGGTLEMRADMSISGLSQGCIPSPAQSKDNQWKRVTVKMVAGGHLVVDGHTMGTGTAYATHPPDAAADLQEMQILNLQHRAMPGGIASSAKNLCDSSILHVHLTTGAHGYAYSQRGIFNVEVRALNLSLCPRVF